MITTGKQLDATKAKKRGLVHQVADPYALEQAAVDAARGLANGSVKASGKKKSLLNRLLEDNPAGRAILFRQARQQGEKKSQGNYPAIPAIFDAVEASTAGGRAGEGSGRSPSALNTRLLTQSAPAFPAWPAQATTRRRSCSASW